jgi:hypothetical protein
MEKIFELIDRANPERFINPENSADVLGFCFLLGLIFLVSYVSFLKIKRKGKQFRIFTVLLGFIISLLLYPIPIWVIPHFQKFSNNEFGIILPRFSGADFSEHLGEKQINEAISLELKNTLMEMRLDTLASIRTISWVVDSRESAKIIKSRYNAKAILYGYATKLQDSYQLTGWLDVGFVGFINIVPNVDTIRVEFETSVGPKVSIDFSGSNFNMKNITQTFIRECLPFMIANLKYKNDEAFVSMVKSLMHYDTDFKENDLSGFLLQNAAERLERTNKLQEAIQVYALSYECFRLFKTRIDSNKADCKMDIRQLRAFAAFSKMREGHIAFSISDPKRGLQCYMTASEMYPVLTPLILKDLESRKGFDKESDTTIEYSVF